MNEKKKWANMNKCVNQFEKEITQRKIYMLYTYISRTKDFINEMLITNETSIQRGRISLWRILSKMRIK